MRKSIKWSFVARGVAICSTILFVLLPLAIYIALSPVVAQPLYSKLIFQPTKYPTGDWSYATIRGIKPTDADFKSENGNSLHGLINYLAPKRQCS